MPFHSLIPILQLAIGPVIVISGVGLVLLSMVNRFGRIIDRTRLAAAEIRNNPGCDHTRLLAQLPILMKRAQLARMSILSATCCMLLIALVIISMFLNALLGIEAALVVEIFFVGAMLCLISCLTCFTLEVNMSLHALKEELTASGIKL